MDYRQRQLFVLGFVLAVCSSVAVQAAESLGEKIMPLLEAHEGKVGFAVKHLKTGETFAHQADVPMSTASLIKLPIMVEAYRQADAGKVDLEKKITLTQDDKVPGSGILTNHFSAGMSLPLQDAIHLMMVYSDNTATNLVLDQIGLPATNDTMVELKLPNTKIHAKVFRGSTSIYPERSKEFGLGSTTAAEMVQLLELLDKGSLASESATKAMRKHLSMCEDKRLSKNLPTGVRVLQKTGSVTAVRTVAGILELPSGNVAICLLTSDNKDRRWATDNAGEVLSAKLGRVICDHFHTGEKATGTGESKLSVGSQGEAVEKLQRALNQKLKPAPDLIVDGEFGPMTQAAVINWQKSQQHKESGEIDRAAWKLLGLPEDQFPK